MEFCGGENSSRNTCHYRNPMGIALHSLDARSQVWAPSASLAHVEQKHWEPV